MRMRMYVRMYVPGYVHENVREEVAWEDTVCDVRFGALAALLHGAVARVINSNCWL